MTDPQSIPASGEQHERAVEAASRSLCDKYGYEQADHGQDWAGDVREAIDAYLASLREQGVVLVALSEVVTALSEQHDMSKNYRQHPEALLPAHIYIERRFGP